MRTSYITRAERSLYSGRGLLANSMGLTKMDLGGGFCRDSVGTPISVFAIVKSDFANLSMSQIFQIQGRKC